VVPQNPWHFLPGVGVYIAHQQIFTCTSLFKKGIKKHK